MACVSGSNITDDGLVFHIDMANTSKSAVGVNLVSQDGQDLTTIGSYGLLARSKVSDPESPTGYALSMRVTDNAVNSASRISIGTGTHISLTDGHVAVTVKKEGPGLNIVPKVYTGGGWYSLSPLDGGSPYITNEYRRFATNVVFNTNSGGPAPAFSMTNGWGLANRDTTTTTFWHSFQATNLIGNTVYVDGVRTLADSIIDIAGNNTVTPINMTLGRVGLAEFDGIDDCIRSSSISGDLTRHSVSIWCKKPTTNSDGLYTSYNGDSNRVRLYDEGTRFYLYSGTGSNGPLSFYTPGDSTQLNVWRNVVMTLDYANNEHKVYINGELVTTNTTSLNEPNSFGNVVIGAHIDYDVVSPSLYNFYDGQISTVMIHDKILTPEQVKTNFTSTRSRYGI